MTKKDPPEYIRRLREMSGEMRIQIAADLSSVVREIAKSAIEQEHPKWGPSQIQQELLSRIYGSNIRSQINRSRP